MNLLNLLENNWFVGITTGIITGIISGILVFFITKWFMDRKGTAEHLKQIKDANDEVILSLKPYIADRGLPRNLNRCFYSYLDSNFTIFIVRYSVLIIPRHKPFQTSGASPTIAYFPFLSFNTSRIKQELINVHCQNSILIVVCWNYIFYHHNFLERIIYFPKWSYLLISFCFIWE